MSSRLKELLKQIASGQADPQAAAGRIDSEFGKDCTVMVSDFSSFIGLTREKGTALALSMVEKSHEISKPILSTLSGNVLRAELDGLVVTFDKTMDAVMAARALSRTFEEHNDKQSDGTRLAICLGIGTGRMIVTENQVFGEQAIMASRLGEAVEGEFEVRLTPEAYEAVKSMESLQFAQAEPVKIGGIEITPYKLILT